MRSSNQNKILAENKDLSQTPSNLHTNRGGGERKRKCSAYLDFHDVRSYYSLGVMLKKSSPILQSRRWNKPSCKDIADKQADEGQSIH